MLDLIVKGGQVVTPQGADVMDVGVQGDKIVAVGWPGTLAADAARVIDATGKIVVPGGIEPHAHIGIPVPEHWAGTPDVFTQPPEAASRAAAFGGVTTVIDFAGTLALDPAKAAQRESILDVLETRGARCSAATAIPTSPSTTSWPARSPAATVGQIGEAIQEGVASFKIFTTFRPIRVPYGHLWSIFAEVAKHGGIMAVHAEEDDVVTFMTEKLKAEGRAQGYNLHLVHNNLSEDLAFRHIIRLAGHTGAAVYFVHTTAKEGVAAVAEARAQGQPVYGEALHHYLQFTLRGLQEAGRHGHSHVPGAEVRRGPRRADRGPDGRAARHHRHRRVHDAQGVQARRRHHRDRVRRTQRHRDAAARGLHEVRGRAQRAADPLRGHHLGQCRAHPRVLSAEGRHPARQRRGPGLDRSRP